MNKEILTKTLYAPPICPNLITATVALPEKILDFVKVFIICFSHISNF
jgi:hypothetical protein